MADVKVIRSGDVKSTPPAGSSEKEGGQTKRIIFPPHVITKNPFWMATSEFNPGHSAHHWHRHISYKTKGCEIIYPKDFESAYYIVSGSGVVQWKTEDGKIREEKVSAGDTLFFPVDVAEHQLLNTGNEKMFVVMCGSPVHKITYTE